MEPMASYPQWPSSADVSLLRSALVEGDPSPSTFRHPLPPGVVDVILEKACYWVCEEVMNEEPVHGVGDANLLYLATGALHVSVKMVKIKLDSHDQGWSSFPQDQGTTRGSWTFGELELVGQDGRSKGYDRRTIFVNLHARNEWQTHEICIYQDDDFIKKFEPGDQYHVYLRSMYPGWRIFARCGQIQVFHSA